MTQLQAPKARRNQDTGRLSFIPSVSPGPRWSRRRGGGNDRSGHEKSDCPTTQGTPGASSRGKPCTFSSVPASSASSMTTTAPSLSSTARSAVGFWATKGAVTFVSAALLTVSAGGPALADDKPGSKPDQPKPPSAMSSVGGARLGQPGTQVNLGTKTPVLPKKVTGRSWMVSDAETGDILASHNAHWRLPPASTLKMLFADTVLPKLPKDQKHKVEPSDLAGMGEGSSLVGVKEDASYSVHDLWLGVFLQSGNDAVHVLSAMNGGVDKTVQDMNRHAEQLQALDTHVVSPDGYDAKGQVSSAYDLSLIARSGLQKKDFREYCSTATAKFPGGGKADDFDIQNTNRLLTGADGVTPYKGIAGVKNGSTTHAGTTFTGVAERDGKVLLVTVMNPDSDESQAVYNESARLLDWGFAAAGKVDPVGELVAPKGAAGDAASKGSPAHGKDHGKGTGQSAAAAKKDDSSGLGIALAITGGVLAVIGAGVFLVNRRWPLPDLVRRLPRR
ncbi:D-alanyl-D-alanine carboxypeptidase [Streptomyces sp. YIM 130001]|uniref:D-alanyl-D-alanine carboxypeptidase family protein n=1 Tax=Streptomyces sp. YIM 130001 TaxID=2259644 RepID=UPI001F0972F4|nr:D-alanyl-D-alanine carboxypeptidase [Streptomyces sp. YIM 130001]